MEVDSDFIKRLPDEEEKEKLNKLDIDVCISGECDNPDSYRESFVENKKNKRWLWYIIEKTTKKVLAFIFGDRSAETLKKLVAFLVTLKK